MAKKIFILDDDEIFLKIYQSMLVAKGYEVFATNNAYKFLIYAKEIKPDILMVDLNMPQTSGLEIIDKLQKEPQLRKTPIVVASSKENKKNINQRGIPFLAKPIGIEKLLSVIEETTKVLIN